MTIKSLRRKLALLISPEIGAELVSANGEIASLKISNDSLFVVNGNFQDALAQAQYLIDRHATRLAPFLTEKEFKAFEQEHGSIILGAPSIPYGHPIPTIMPDPKA